MPDYNQFRISGDQIKQTIEKYKGVSNTFFSLKNDGETAQIRFEHTDQNDLDILVLHKVLFEGRDKYFLCPAAHGQPCAICENGGLGKPVVRLILTLTDLRDKAVKIWDRPNTEVANIIGLIARYGNLDTRIYEIVRHGAPYASTTNYQFFEMGVIPKEQYVPAKRESIIGPNSYVIYRDYEEVKSLVMNNIIQLIPKKGQAGASQQGGSFGYQPQQQQQGGYPAPQQPPKRMF